MYFCTAAFKPASSGFENARQLHLNARRILHIMNFNLSALYLIFSFKRKQRTVNITQIDYVDIMVLQTDLMLL